MLEKPLWHGLHLTLTFNSNSISQIRNYTLDNTLHFVLEQSKENAIYVGYDDRNKTVFVDVKYDGLFKGRKVIAQW